MPTRRARFASMSQLDAALEGFAEQQFLDGCSKYVVTCALQNVNMEYPMWPTSSRTNFPATKSAKKGWGTLEPNASRDPCPLEIAWWIAHDMVSRSLPLFAAGVVLAFDTYLRPGKLCSLRQSNVIPPARSLHKRYKFWSLLLHPQEEGDLSKVGQFNDSLTVGSKDREWISQILGKIYVQHSGSRNALLFPFNLGQFEKEFSISCERLGLQKLRLSPHCLRHGGASFDYFAGYRTLADVQQRGCWGSYESVRRYAKHARLTRQLNLLTVAQQQAAKQAVLNLPRFLLDHL